MTTPAPNLPILEIPSKDHDRCVALVYDFVRGYSERALLRAVHLDKRVRDGYYRERIFRAAKAQENSDVTMLEITHQNGGLVAVVDIWRFTDVAKIAAVFYGAADDDAAAEFVTDLFDELRKLEVTDQEPPQKGRRGRPPGPTEDTKGMYTRWLKLRSEKGRRTYAVEAAELGLQSVDELRGVIRAMKKSGEKID